MPLPFHILALARMLPAALAGPFAGFALIACAIGYARLRAGR